MNAARPLRALLLPAAVFVSTVWLGLPAAFDGDDLMNLHEAVEKNALWRIALGFVVPNLRTRTMVQAEPVTPRSTIG